MNMVFFYNCNMRANLIQRDFEKPIDFSDDALDRGIVVHVAVTNIFARYCIYKYL